MSDTAAPVGVDGLRNKELAALVAPAAAELKTRTDAAHPEPELQAWRRIIEWLEHGALTLPEGERPADAFAAMLDVAHAALHQRVAKCAALPRTVGEDGAADPNPEALERRIAALKQLRDLLLRAAIRAGATVPSFDAPERAGGGGVSDNTSFKPGRETHGHTDDRQAA